MYDQLVRMSLWLLVEAKMITSRYNIKFKCDGGVYVFNTRTLSILDVSNTVFDGNEDFYTADISEAEKLMLIENGFIFDGTDETGIINYDFSSYATTNKELYLSILTTQDCNFRCPYCFEVRSDTYLSRENANRILKLVEQKAQEAEILKVDWYGGEPLLNSQMIGYLSEKLIKICDEYDVEYIASITTNGSLLDEKSVALLERSKVTHAQITIDGPRDVHDSRRYTEDKQGTYNTILSNISRFKDRINFIIRINVDKTNLLSVDDLLKEISEHNFSDIPIAIKGIVSSFAPQNSDIELRGKYLSDVIYQKYKLAYDLKLNPAIFQLFEFNSYRFCVVDSHNQFIVDPNARVFKCGSSFLADDPGYVGGIVHDGSFCSIPNKLCAWYKNLEAYQECQSCIILPMCYGGCMMKRVEGVTIPCNIDLKYHLVDYLKMYIKTLGVANEKE